MARQRSNFAKRMQKMRGVEAVEKSLLIRVGELADAIIDNSTPSNARTSATRNRRDPRLPPPTSITTESGVRGVIIDWPKVDSSILLHYEVEITNLDNGTTETKITYTNRTTFKGRTGGKYVAKIRSIGRNGTSSPITEQEFFVSDNVMLLEGSKNSFNTIGTEVSEDIFMQEGHTVFAWGHLVIDRLIGGSVGNPVVSLQLYRTPQGAGINNVEAVLLEEISLFDATTSSTNLDDNTFVTPIERPSLQAPASGDPSFVRGTTLETAHSVMFSPVPVTSSQAQLQFDFHLVAIGREIPNDIVNLSLSLWSANEGQGSQVPTDPQVTDPEIEQTHRKSIILNNNLATVLPGSPPENHRLGESFAGYILPSFRTVGPDWTFACWFKFGTKTGPLESTEFSWLDSWAGSINGQLFDRREADLSSPFTARANNSIRIIPGWNFISGDGVYAGQLQIFINDAEDGGVQASWFRRENTPAFNGRTGPGNTGPWGGIQNALMWSVGPAEWNFLTIFFRSGFGINVYVNGRQKTNNVGPFDTTVVQDFGDSSASDKTVFTFGMPSINVLDGNGDFPGDSAGDGYVTAGEFIIHKAALWNYDPGVSNGVNVSDGNREGFHGALFNNWDGQEVNWFQNDGLFYDGANNMVHYWGFGANTSKLELLVRDGGLNPAGLGENWDENGDVDLSNTGPDDLVEAGERALNNERDFRRTITIADNVLDDFPTNAGLFQYDD
jgi:hypothetical protein